MIAAGALFYFTSTKSKAESDVTERLLEETPLELQPIRTFVDRCIEDISVPAVYVLALQGGYLYPIPEYSLVTENTIVAYYYNGSDIIAPSLEEMKQQLEAYMLDTLPICIDNFSSFPGRTIEQGNITVNADILKNRILLNVKYPITLAIENNELKTEEFIMSLPVRLDHIYSISQKIVNNVIEDPDHIDMAYLASFDADITMLPHDDATVVYSIVDGQSSIEDVPLVFMFAIKTFQNSAPKMDFMPNFLLKKGEEFSYDANASDADGDKLSYYSNSTLIDIDSETGVFYFTPSNAETYSAEICAEDGHGKKDCRNMKFFVE